MTKTREVTIAQFIFDYLEEKEQTALSYQEQRAIEKGVSMYLWENGIDYKSDSAYFKRYVKRHLMDISCEDLKAYFIMYPTLSEVYQIALCQKEQQHTSEDDKQKLATLLLSLYKAGLGEKYIPVYEVREALEI